MRTRARVTAVLAVLAAVICSPIAVRAETALEALAAGEELLNGWCDREAARAAFERAVALDPELAMPHYYLCRLDASDYPDEEGDRARAMAECDVFRRLADPDDPAQREAISYVFHYLMMRVYRHDDSPAARARRLAWYQLFVEVEGLERVGSWLIGAYLGTDQPEQAIATADEVLKVVTDPAQRWHIEELRLQAFLQTAQGEGELAARERAVAERPDDAAAHLALADVYNALGRHDDALKENTRAAELGAAEGHARLAQSQVWRQPKLAAKECLATMRIEPGNWRAARLVVSGGGLPIVDRNRYNEGLVPHIDLDPETMASLVWNPGYTWPYLQLARIYLERDDAVSAERMARRALEGGVKPRLVCGLLVRCYLKSDRQDEINDLVEDLAGRAGDEASDVISAAVEALLYDGEARPEVASLIEDPRLIGEKRARAISWYASWLHPASEAAAFIDRELTSPRRASLSQAEVEDLYAKMIGYYRSARDYEGALAAGRRYVEEFPESSRAHHWLGSVLRDDPAAAEAAYRRALELLPIGHERVGPQYDLARLLMGQGRDQEAVVFLQEACRSRCGYQFEPHLALGEALANLGRIEEAEQALDTALSHTDGTGLSARSPAMDRLAAVFQTIEGEGDVNVRLEAELAKHPNVSELAEYLMYRYVEQRRFDDVTRLAEQYGGPTGPASGLKKRAAELLRQARDRDQRAASLWERVLANLSTQKEWRVRQLSSDCVAAWKSAGSLDELRTKTAAALAERPDSVVLKMILTAIGDGEPAPE